MSERDLTRQCENAGCSSTAIGNSNLCIRKRNQTVQSTETQWIFIEEIYCVLSDLIMTGFGGWLTMFTGCCCWVAHLTTPAMPLLWLWTVFSHLRNCAHNRQTRKVFPLNSELSNEPPSCCSYPCELDRLAIQLKSSENFLHNTRPSLTSFTSIITANPIPISPGHYHLVNRAHFSTLASAVPSREREKIIIKLCCLCMKITKTVLHILGRSYRHSPGGAKHSSEQQQTCHAYKTLVESNFFSCLISNSKATLMMRHFNSTVVSVFSSQVVRAHRVARSAKSWRGLEKRKSKFSLKIIELSSV